LAKLRPVFANGGSVTAGNSSQMSDGAAFVMVMSENGKRIRLEPEARLVAYAAAGLEPRIMGMGPIYAIPKALKQAG
jgi:acetyl-CoA acyltransferase